MYHGENVYMQILNKKNLKDLPKGHMGDTIRSATAKKKLMTLIKETSAENLLVELKKNKNLLDEIKDPKHAKNVCMQILNKKNLKDLPKVLDLLEEMPGNIVYFWYAKRELNQIPEKTDPRGVHKVLKALEKQIGKITYPVHTIDIFSIALNKLNLQYELGEYLKHMVICYFISDHKIPKETILKH